MFSPFLDIIASLYFDNLFDGDNYPKTSIIKMKHLNIILYQNNKHLAVDFNSKIQIKNLQKYVAIEKMV